MTKDKNIWVFDRSPASNRGRGADTIRMLFEGEGSLVKEGVQNAADQLRKTNKLSIPIGKIEINLAEFSGDEKEKIKDLIDWENLRRHCEAAVEKTPGTAESIDLSKAIDRLNDREINLRVLSISDFGTEGLADDFEGLADEAERDTNYTQLCRDEHNTSNNDETRSGSHGLGKIVNWKHSGINTVLFNSLTWRFKEKKDELHMRTCGQCLLWSHRLDEKTFDNAGYFGQEKTLEANVKTAISAWDDPSLANALGLSREVSKTSSGTSVTIIDYWDAENPDETGPETIDRLRADVERYFWPALQANSESSDSTTAPNLQVSLNYNVNGDARYQTAATSEEYISFKRALDEAPNTQIISGVDQIAAADGLDVTVRSKETPKEQVNAKMNVRLCSAPLNTIPESVADHVAKLRDRVMVIEYEKINISSEKEFDLCGVVALGFARGNEESDTVAHNFLRMYEPPAHDNWQFFQKVKVLFKDFRKLIGEITSTYRKSIKELTSKKVETEGQPVQLLSQLLNFGISGQDTNVRTTDTQPISLVGEEEILKATFNLKYTNQEETRRDEWSSKLTFNIKGANLRLIPVNIEFAGVEENVDARFSTIFGPKEGLLEHQVQLDIEGIDSVEVVAHLKPPQEFSVDEIVSGMTVDVRSTLVEE